VLANAGASACKFMVTTILLILQVITTPLARCALTVTSGMPDCVRAEAAASKQSGVSSFQGVNCQSLELGNRGLNFLFRESAITLTLLVAQCAADTAAATR
jgi:hypothetical protein